MQHATKIGIIPLKQIPRYHLVIRAMIDLPFWFLLFWRDYSNQYNWVIQHYYWFLVVPSIFNYCTQIDRQN